MAVRWQAVLLIVVVSAGCLSGPRSDPPTALPPPIMAPTPTLPAVPTAQAPVPLGPHVVVALVDYSGVNVYHAAFHESGLAEPAPHQIESLVGSPVRRLDLDRGQPWADAVEADEDRLAWKSGDLVEFAGTGLLGIHFDSSLERFSRSSHGTTMVAVFRHESPHGIVVKPDATVDGALARFQWVVDQPWIDVIGMSWTTAPFEQNPQGISDPLRPFECTLYGDPVTAQVTRLTKLAADRGKIVVTAAGNEPTPIELAGSLQGPPWMLGIAGSESGGQGKASFSENGWPDFVANYTWASPEGGTTGNETYVGSGTSFASPAAAGVVAEVIYRLRSALGYSGGITDGQIAPGFTAADVRAALNRSAILPDYSGYTVGSNASIEGPTGPVPLPDHTHPPGAPWLTAQWGHLDGRVVEPAIAALLGGELGVPDDKAPAAAWKQQTYAARTAYWDQWAEDCA